MFVCFAALKFCNNSNFLIDLLEIILLAQIYNMEKSMHKHIEMAVLAISIKINEIYFLLFYLLLFTSAVNLLIKSSGLIIVFNRTFRCIGRCVGAKVFNSVH